MRYGEGADPVWRLHFRLAPAGKLGNLREFDKAESLIDEAEAGLHARDTRVRGAAPAAMRARLFLQAGRVADARRQAELATTAADRDAAPMLRPLAYSVLSTISLHKGDLPAATEYLKRVRGEFATDQAVLYSSKHRALLETCGREVDEAEVVRAIGRTTAYNEEIGNSCTASVYLALAALLDTSDDLTGRAIGLLSYGSGSVAEFFAAVPVPGYRSQPRSEQHGVADLPAPGDRLRRLPGTPRAGPPGRRRRPSRAEGDHRAVPAGRAVRAQAGLRAALGPGVVLCRRRRVAAPAAWCCRRQGAAGYPQGFPDPGGHGTFGT
ncbi:hydroxymethylglutaryl-CoA synthase [Streptomyces sp. NPDC051546]|uniref:hydroxymethylglutaryl-CoA synthase n=1 Tax=Streptomyces sp. NPDC051546 TaxID=3365655 RepID=UPI00378DE6DE